jgi:hypothetical protein
MGILTGAFGQIESESPTNGRLRFEVSNLSRKNKNAAKMGYAAGLGSGFPTHSPERREWMGHRGLSIAKETVRKDQQPFLQRAMMAAWRRSRTLVGSS